jgi:hypothetical protein
MNQYRDAGIWEAGPRDEIETRPDLTMDDVVARLRRHRKLAAA